MEVSKVGPGEFGGKFGGKTEEGALDCAEGRESLVHLLEGRGKGDGKSSSWDKGSEAPKSQILVEVWVDEVT